RCPLFLPENGEWRLNVIRPGRDATAAARPVRMEKLAARPVHALVGVSAEEVALRLQQIRRQTLGAVSVEERERRREGGRRHAVLDGLDDGAPPRGLIFIQSPAEEIVEQQIGQLRILVEGLFDLAEKAATDDAAAAPHQRDAAVVQVPSLLF